MQRGAPIHAFAPEPEHVVVVDRLKREGGSKRGGERERECVYVLNTMQATHWSYRTVDDFA